MPVLSYNLFSLQGFVIVDVGFFNAVSCQHLKIRISGCLAMPFLISRWHQQAVAERRGPLGWGGSSLVHHHSNPPLYSVTSPAWSLWGFHFWGLMITWRQGENSATLPKRQEINSTYVNRISKMNLKKINQFSFSMVKATYKIHTKKRKNFSSKQKHSHQCLPTGLVKIKNDDNTLSWQGYRNWQAQTLLIGEVIRTMFWCTIWEELPKLKTYIHFGPPTQGFQEFAT